MFQNLKTLNEQKDVCDYERKGHAALNNIMREVKRDWAKYEADLLYQKVYKKYGRDQRPMPLKYAYILESRNHVFPVM